MLNKINEYEGKELTFAGIISNVQHKVGKNGKPWGMFTFEDYTDAYEFRLFSEDYLKFRHYLIPNTFLHIKIILRRGWQNGDVRIQFTAINQLQDVLSKMAKKITIQLDVNAINDKNVATMNSVLKQYKGKQNLNFLVYDADEKLKLTMPSRTSKIEISKEMIEELTTNDYKFKLN
jgi:DNA polymerase-3 subunit alpha